MKLQQTAIEAQQAAISEIKPGVTAEFIAHTANQDYMANGEERRDSGKQKDRIAAYISNSEPKIKA
jgi:Xaa-Pro aminopeptidase